MTPDASGLAAELSTLRTGAGVCRHDQRALVGVTGGDALPWLERIASNPVADIGPDRYVAATLMDGKGRLRAALRILALGADRDLLLDLPASHKDAILRLLDMYVIQDDVTLGDLSAERELASVLGPDAARVLGDADLPVPADGAIGRPADGDDVAVLPSRLAGAPGYDVLAPRAAMQALVGRLVAAGAARVGTPALEVLRIANGAPWFGPDLSADVIPLEALLDDHVSITKGCYPGQEVVARIQNLGQVSRKLVRLSAPGDAGLAAGTELTGTGAMQGKPAGVVTSVAFDPEAGLTRALGFARRAFWKSGTVLDAAGTPLTVASLAGD